MDKPLIAVFNSDHTLIGMIKDVLESDEYQVVTGYIPHFRSGERSLEVFLAEHNPDLIIYGLGPDYKGEWESLLMRVLPHFTIPILVLVTIGSAFEMLRSNPLIDRIMMKPMHIGRLLDTIQELLSTEERSLAA